MVLAKVDAGVLERGGGEKLTVSPLPLAAPYAFASEDIVIAVVERRRWGDVRW